MPTILLLVALLTAVESVQGQDTPGVAASGPAATAVQPEVSAERAGPGADTEGPGSAPPEKTNERFFDLRHHERVTGEWRGVRPWLEEQGVEIALSLTAVYLHNARGGLETHHGHRITGSADLELTFNLEQLLGWSGAVVYLDAESTWGDDIGGDLVGNWFGVNGDAGGDEAILVRELWLEQTFWDGKARGRVGKIDLTVDFDTNAYANDETAQFLNPALINTGNLPVPDPGLGVQFVVQPVDWWYLGAGAGDAEADVRETGLRTALHGNDYFFFVLEQGFMPVFDAPWGKLPGGYRLGLWYDPQPKWKFVSDWGGQRRSFPYERDDLGFYVSVDQVLWREHATDDGDTQGLGVFCRYGHAAERVNEMEHFLSFGAQYEGLLPTRDEDVLGFGFAQGIVSDRLRWLERLDREYVYECYYNIKLLPAVNLTPDFQYIVNPGADDAGRDAFVAGLRVQISF